MIKFIYSILIVSCLFIFIACSSEPGIEEELLGSVLYEDSIFGEIAENSPEYTSVFKFLLEVVSLEENQVYDYIIGYEHFYFTTMLLQTRWNGLVHDIRWSFWEDEDALAYLEENYDEIWEYLYGQIRFEVAMTLLAYLLGYEANEEDMSNVLLEIEYFIQTISVDNEELDVESLFLYEFGVTQEQWQVQVERHLAAIAMIDSIWDANPVNDSMIESFIESMDELHLPYFATVYHILVSNYYLALELKEKIVNGFHPRELHDEFSQDPGGPVYTFPRGVMVEPFEEWAFSAEVGDIGIILSQFGYHVTLSYGKELHVGEIEYSARLHYLDLYIKSLFEKKDLRWSLQPDIIWIPDW